MERHIAALACPLTHHANLRASCRIALERLELLIGEVWAVERNPLAALPATIGTPGPGDNVAAAARRSAWSVDRSCHVLVGLVSTVASRSGTELCYSGVTSGALKNGSLVTEIEASG
jgi:hypothetical protein